MAIYDLYGTLSPNMREVKESLEAALDIHFEVRDSAYQGGEYFFFGRRTDENFILKRNIDPIDNDPVETKFPEYEILLYVNETLRSLDLQRKIIEKAVEFVLLKRQDL